jgi:hypothetical protein
MSLANYTDLQASVASWLNRTDLTTQIVDAIRMFEARANRLLRVREMQATLASTALSSGAANLPTGFLEFEELRSVTSGKTLQPKSLESIRRQDTTASGDPAYFAVAGTQVVCWPQSGNIQGTYYVAIPALASNATNWLLTSHPDIYLLGSLEEMSMYIKDDERIPLWARKCAALMEHLQSASERSEFAGGPIRMTVR